MNRFVLIYRTMDGLLHCQRLDADMIAEAFMEALLAVKPAEVLYPDHPLDILGVVDEDMLPPGSAIINPHVSLI